VWAAVATPGKRISATEKNFRVHQCVTPDFKQTGLYVKPSARKGGYAAGGPEAFFDVAYNAYIGLRPKVSESPQTRQDPQDPQIRKPAKSRYRAQSRYGFCWAIPVVWKISTPGAVADTATYGEKYGADSCHAVGAAHRELRRAAAATGSHTAPPPPGG